ncbi:hypothetical protein L3Q72_03990 [Vibrio sp. JC009]|uniref:pyruvate formate lyase family protein n=1 Tax=Vibrio sp. JC009 TaxID=2912314 RepID=UPI0023B139D8|nr:pyruvate formate lyase family protein [Vibrio sp. JC009]WED22565.1 hypothetical protein L3Q72_03990 [Vibrio sp. JC009]
MTAPTVTMSKRVKYIFDRRHNYYDRKEIPKRAPHYHTAFAKHEHDSKSIQIAMGFKNFICEKKILVCEHDILAGFAYRYTYKPSSPFNLPQDYDPLYRPPAGIDTFEEAEAGILANNFASDSQEAEEMRTFAQCVSKWLYKHWESGHIIPGFESLIQDGIGGRIQQIEAALEQANSSEKDDLQAMLICQQAASEYITRYADHTALLSKQTDDINFKSHLDMMEQSLRNISHKPAQTFFEAVQLVWLTHEMLYAENFPASFSFGRMDEYLFPFYEKDLKNGVMTKEQAVDIIDALWLKFGITLHGYQNITLGGLDKNNNYVANELTVMMLQASRKTRFDQPLLCLRYHESMPEHIWEESIALLQTGIGLPAIFIDDFCIKTKMQMGQSKEDALNYGLVGCVEMACPGKEYSKTEALRINLGKILEIMFFDGKSNSTTAGGIIGNSSIASIAVSKESIQNYKFPLFSGYRFDQIASFEELFDWYKSELSEQLKFSMTAINRLDSALPKCYPTPFLSAFMDGCIENGKDVTAGGAIYNNSAVNLCGMANVVDSLCAIRTLVFEEKQYSLQDFKQAMKSNYEGYEDLHLAIQRKCPKFGNDIDKVDSLMAELVASANSVVESFTNPRGGRWQMGLYSVEDHVKMGINTGALPDGRRNGEAMASAISPVQGKDINGPTAAINSLLKTDLSVATNGMVLDIKFSPTFFDKKSHHQALRMLVQAYAEQGGGEIQFNVMDRNTLLDAQTNPEQYKDLVVRVSGFSAYFTSLVKETQDEIILRTEHMGV